jgi:putative Holliday junction resolvase
VKRILAVDWGEKRLGLALSDTLGLTAQPLPPIHLQRTSDAVRAIVELVDAHAPARIVLGLPLELSGRRGSAADAVDALAKSLAKRVTIPIDLWDERFTSALAEQSLREEGARFSRRSGGARGEARTVKADKAKIDQRAAILLLQSWLDAHPGAGGAGEEDA